MSDGYPTDEQLLSQARRLRREAHELERIGHALSLAAGRRRFLDDARDLHARADRLEAQVRNAAGRVPSAEDAPLRDKKVSDSPERS